METNNSKMLIAKRGCVFKFQTPNSQHENRYALVVSSDARQTERFVSILVLYDNNTGTDIVEIDVPTLGTKYVHIGMVTYTLRQNLSDFAGSISADDMAKVNTALLAQLGLVSSSLVYENNTYKKMYDELVEKMLNSGVKN